MKNQKYIYIINKLKKYISRNRDNPLYSQRLFWSSTLLWAIVGSLGFGLVYSLIARIDEVVIARGELQAKGAERPIKSPFVSIVSEIKVTEGQKVKKGQLLIQLDSKTYESNLEGLDSKLVNLLVTKDLQLDIVNRLSYLKTEGAISLIDFLKEKKNLQQINSEIEQTQAKIRGINSEILKTKLISPTNGTVFNLIPSNPGYVTASGETLLLIVPEGTLEAKIFLTNKDVGFARKNMNAEIRVDAYPFTQFGSISGKLKSIGQEVLPADQQNPQPRFPAIVKLDMQYLYLNENKYALKSGQSVSVNLIVRDKPLITLLTSSIERAFDALRGIKSDLK